MRHYQSLCLEHRAGACGSMSGALPMKIASQQVIVQGKMVPMRNAVDNHWERSKMVRVLFICLGNICRSPMAEAVFLQKVRAEGLEKEIEADSAGTGRWHIGKPAHEGTLRMLREKDIAISHQARQLEAVDLKDFDYVITMDDDNLADVRALGPGRATVRPLMEYAPQTGITEVPDPYYTGGFPEVFRLIDVATTGLLAAIRREHGL
jgi:protein-tyrosine phosphatase